MKPVPGTYAVKPLQKIKASHEFWTGGPHPTEGYPEKLQPRAYEPGNAESAKVYSFAQMQIPGFWISTHPAADNGPPCVTPKGIVLNGNGRVMALQLAASRDEYGWYKRALEAAAHTFGIDPERVRSLELPILVRVVKLSVPSERARKFARAGNISMTQAEGPIRTAANLAGLMSHDLIKSLTVDEETTFSQAVTADTAAANQFRVALGTSLPPSEASRYIKPDGRLTGSGVELVRFMLLVHLFPVEILEALAVQRAGLTRTLEGVAPILLEIRRRYKQQDVIPAFTEALAFIAREPEVKSIKQAQEVEGQQHLFGTAPPSLSPSGQDALGFILTNESKPRVFRQQLGMYLRSLAEASGLFGSATDVKAAQRKLYRGKNPSGKPRRKAWRTTLTKEERAKLKRKVYEVILETYDSWSKRYADAKAGGWTPPPEPSITPTYLREWLDQAHTPDNFKVESGKRRTMIVRTLLDSLVREGKLETSIGMSEYGREARMFEPKRNNPAALHVANPNVGRGLTWNPTGLSEPQGDPRYVWSSPGGLSAHLYIGLNLGPAPRWSQQDVVQIVKKVRTEQTGNPNSSFLMQRGVYTQEGVGVVDEQSVQVTLYDEGGTTPEVWYEQMTALGQVLADKLCQDTVLVELRNKDITYFVGGVGGAPVEACLGR